MSGLGPNPIKRTDPQKYETVNVRKDQYEDLCALYANAKGCIDVLRAELLKKQQIIDVLALKGRAKRG